MIAERVAQMIMEASRAQFYCSSLTCFSAGIDGRSRASHARQARICEWHSGAGLSRKTFRRQ